MYNDPHSTRRGQGVCSETWPGIPPGAKDGMTAGRRDVGGRAAAGLLAGLLALGTWPWISSLHFASVTKDGAVWIARGSVSNPDWFQWVFLTRHFNVGYRPLAAFSYTLISAVVGFEPWLYRLAALVLHLWVGLSIYLLWRLLAREAPRWGGLLATGLFLAHPIVEQVVPSIPRLSYTLAMALSQAGLVIFLAGLSRNRALAPFSIPATLAGLLLAGALLANEAAVIATLILPLLVFYLLASPAQRTTTSSTPRPAIGKVVRLCAVPFGLTVLAVATRTLGVGDLVGGYDRETADVGMMLSMLARGWRDLGSLQFVGGEAAGLAALPTGSFLLLAIAIYYGLRTLGEPLLDRSSPGNLLTLALVAWILSYVGMYTALNVWYARQSYFILIPLCLLLAWIFQRTIAIRSFPRMLLLLLPQLLLAVHLLLVSPLVQGPDATRVELWEQRSRRLLAMEQAISGVIEPATVWMVQPYVEVENRLHQQQAGIRPPVAGPRRIDTQPAIWMKALFQTRDIQVVPLLFYEVNPLDPGGWPVYDATGSRPILKLAPDRRHYLATGTREGIGLFQAFRSAPGQEVFPLDFAALPADRNLYLYIQEEGSSGRIIPVPRDDGSGTP